VERELRALAHRAREDEQGGREQRDRVRVARLEHRVDRLADVERRLAGRARVHPDGHDPEREPEIADTVDDERLLGRERRGALAEPEADEQVAAQPDQLPRDEHDQPRVREDQQQHGEHEEIEVGEEPPVARVVAHVPDRVDVDEQADRGDDDQQAGRQRVDEEADFDDEVAGRDPGEPVQRVAVGVLRAREQRRGAGEDPEGHGHRDDPRAEDDQHRDPVGPLAQAPSDQSRECEPCDRQDDQQWDQGLERHLDMASYSSTSGVFLLR
jgi:hypothetical protein